VENCGIQIGKGVRRKGSISIERVEVKGDVFSSLRKGRNIICYDFEMIKIHWTGIVDDDMTKAGNPPVSVHGYATLEDISNVSTEDLTKLLKNIKVVTVLDKASVESGSSPKIGDSRDSVEDINRVARKVALIQKTCRKKLPEQIQKQMLAFSDELSKK